MEDSRLTLLGGGYTLRDAECPSAVFRKQTSLSGTWSTIINFNPEVTWEEAGTVVYLATYAYLSLFLRRGTSGRQIVAQWPAESGDGFDETCADIADGPVELYIKATPMDYSLSYRSTEMEAPKELTRCSIEVLHRDRGQPVFTGPHFGLFCQSNNEPSRSVAHFDWASFSTDA